MLAKFCIWYLKHIMKKHLPHLEMIISADSKTYRKRNIEREESIKDTLSKIK